MKMFHMAKEVETTVLQLWSEAIIRPFVKYVLKNSENS